MGHDLDSRSARKQIRTMVAFVWIKNKVLEVVTRNDSARRPKEVDRSLLQCRKSRRRPKRLKPQRPVLQSI